MEAEALARAVKSEADHATSEDKKGVLNLLASTLSAAGGGKSFGVDTLLDDALKLLGPLLGKKDLKKARKVVEEALPAITGALGGHGTDESKN